MLTSKLFKTLWLRVKWEKEAVIFASHLMDLDSNASRKDATWVSIQYADIWMDVFSIWKDPPLSQTISK